MSKRLMQFAAANIALAIMLGAFGAHALTNILDLPYLSTFHTASYYHLLISVALLAIGTISVQASLKKAPIIIAIGMLLFSGSLYLLALIHINALTAIAYALALPQILGPITPIGGLLMIIGCCVLIWELGQNNDK